MRIFKNVWFRRFARREEIKDDVLREAVARAEKGLVDADLGGGVIKQRIARTGQGKSGGYRSIIFFRKGQRAFFVYGFAKNDRDNIDAKEMADLKRAAKEMFALSDEKIKQAIADDSLMEVAYESKE